MRMRMAMPSSPAYTIIMNIHTHPPQSVPWASWWDIRSSRASPTPFPVVILNRSGIRIWDPTIDTSGSHGIQLYGNNWREIFARGCQ